MAGELFDDTDDAKEERRYYRLKMMVKAGQRNQAKLLCLNMWETGKHPRCAYLLGQLHEADGAPEVALRWYGIAFLCNRRHSLYATSYARALAERGLTAEGLWVTQHVLDQHPVYGPARQLQKRLLCERPGLRAEAPAVLRRIDGLERPVVVLDGGTGDQTVPLAHGWFALVSLGIGVGGTGAAQFRLHDDERLHVATVGVCGGWRVGQNDLGLLGPTQVPTSVRWQVRCLVRQIRKRCREEMPERVGPALESYWAGRDHLRAGRAALALPPLAESYGLRWHWKTRLLAGLAARQCGRPDEEARWLVDDTMWSRGQPSAMTEQARWMMGDGRHEDGRRLLLAALKHMPHFGPARRLLAGLNG